MPPGLGRGRDVPARAPLGLAAVADPFPADWLIPKSEWQAIIQDRQRFKATMKEFLLSQGVKVLNQQMTNYCWCNAPTFSVMVVRAKANQKNVRLSPASVGGPLTSYRNVGGWGKDALQRISDVGVVPQDLWPANDISRRYDTPATWAAAKKYRIPRWIVCVTLEQVISCVLRGYPVPVGYNWWGHEVCAVDVNWRDGEPTLIIANSWDDTWGDQGYGELQGRRMIPDDAVCPITARAA